MLNPSAPEPSDEELTANYQEFHDVSEAVKLDWAIGVFQSISPRARRMLLVVLGEKWTYGSSTHYYTSRVEGQVAGFRLSRAELTQEEYERMYGPSLKAYREQRK